MLIKMLITTALVAITALGITSGLVYMDRATRTQQITEDMDGIFRTAIAVLVSKIESSGGPYRFAIEHLAGPNADRVDPVITNTLNSPSNFQSVFGVPMTIDALNLSSDQHRSFIGVDLVYTFEIYAFGSSPTTYKKVTGSVRLSEVAYYRILVRPAPGAGPNDGIARRGVEQIISL